MSEPVPTRDTVLAAMRSGEWLRTQWIARVVYGLGDGPWEPSAGAETRRVLARLLEEGSVEHRKGAETRSGSVASAPMSVDIPRDEWRHAPTETGPFDGDELVRWAEDYGHPEEWAHKAKAAHLRAESAESSLEAERARTRALEDALRELVSVTEHTSVHPCREQRGADAMKAALAALSPREDA